VEALTFYFHRALKVWKLVVLIFFINFFCGLEGPIKTVTSLEEWCLKHFPQ
jgi:hypothetical protein